MYRKYLASLEQAEADSQHSNTTFNMAAIPEANKCAYNYVGKSGLKVSNLCMGTMTFGESNFGLPEQASEADSHQLLDRFVEWGGNFIDTADVYGVGKSEEIVGRWLEKRARDDFVVATKVRLGMGTEKNRNNQGLSRRHITASIDNSLKRLKTDYVDLYQSHCFDNAVTLEETLRTFDDLVRAGKVRYVGLCNVTGWQLQKIVCTTEKLGLNPIVSLQQQYSLLCRYCESEPFQVCKSEGLGVLPWSPLRGGALTGKVRRNQAPTDGRMKWIHDNKDKLPRVFSTMSEHNFDLLDAIERIGKAKGKSIPQVSLRWLVQKDVVSSTIIGAKTIKQLDDNMGASNGWSLTKEEMEELDKLSYLEVNYPYDTINSMNIDRDNLRAHNFTVKSTF